MEGDTMKLNLKPSKETKIATNEQIQKKEVTEKKEFTKLYKYTTKDRKSVV